MITNRSDNTSMRGKSQAMRMHKRMLLVIISIMAICVIVCLSLISISGNTSASFEKGSKPKKSIKRISSPAPTSRQREVYKPVQEQTSENAEREKLREMFSKMSVDERIDYLREQIKNMPIPETPTNRLYATSLEQTMDWIFSCEVGNPPPILPPMSLFDQMHLAEILIRDNPVLDTDSDKAAESKEMMRIAKKEFIKYLKEGGYPDDFLPYYHGQLVAAHDEYKTARQSIIEILKNEPDIAIDYIKKVNERLSEKGIKKVVIPPKMLDAFGIDSEELD